MKKVALAMLLYSAAARADVPSPAALSQERVIFHTNAGDLVFVLYPEAAPKTVAQFLQFVNAGVYDTTDFSRIRPGFIAQVSSASERKQPLTPAQSALIHRLPLEAGAFKHERAVLSMAHQEGDPASGETSFCIMLGPAPHLDGKYTVFGKLESGEDVVTQILRVPRDAASRPEVRVEISKAEVVPTADALARLTLAKAHEVPGVTPAMLAAAALGAAAAPRVHTGAGSDGFIAVGLFLIVLLGAVSTLLRSRIAPRHVLSLNLAGVLIAAFLLFVLLMPVGQHRGWVAACLFFGLVGVFKLMGRFEDAEGR